MPISYHRPGGGFSLDGQHWIACRPGFFLSVLVLSRLFRRLSLERLTAAHQAGRLEFFADQAALTEPAAFKAHHQGAVGTYGLASIGKFLAMKLEMVLRANAEAWRIGGISDRTSNFSSSSL